MRCVRFFRWGLRRSPLQAQEPKHRLLRSRRGPMLSPAFSISPIELWRQIGTADAPQLIDVRRRDIYESTPGLLPASIWQEPTELPRWISTLDRTRPIVVACKAGKELSQLIAAELRGAGYRGVDAGRRQLRLERRRAADGRSRHADAVRAAAAQRLGDAAAAEDRPHRLPLADPPLHRRRARKSCSSIRPMSKPRRPKSAAFRSTSPMSKSRMTASAAASTPCSSCSAWKASRRWRGWR